MFPTTSYRKSTVDYIIIPAHLFPNVLAFDIVTDSYLDFNTDHNMLHLITQDSAASQTELPSPSGLDDDAVLFPKFALTDPDLRDAYKAYLSNLLKPWVKKNFVRLVAEH